MNKFIIDFQTKQLTFLDSRFYTTPDGFLPSVTTILEAYPKDAAYFQWIKSVGQDADAIRDAAGDRGTTVHELTERYDNGEEITLLTESGALGYKLQEWAMFERYVDYTIKCSPRIEQNEQNYVSPELGYAGTIDRVINVGGVRYLMDIKTSNAIYPTYWLQLAAYRELLDKVGGVEVDAVAILWLNAKTRTEGKKGSIQGKGWQLLTREDTTTDLQVFKATKYLWGVQNADSMPRQSSYQLSHKKP
jgi:hypothetical protein